MKPTLERLEEYRDALAKIIAQTVGLEPPDEESAHSILMVRTHYLLMEWVIEGHEGIDRLVSLTIADANEIK